ncbi:hypothetical protein N9B82_06625 [Saprospiraceae bacterium]|nr:hypothetical protein [Saprospiraceae bacterium]
MGLFDNIKRLFVSVKNSAIFSDEELENAGVCPNCWGKQDYDDKFHEVLKDQTKSNINKDKSAQKAFIQQFVETNVTGIKLKSDGDHAACPACKARF